MAPPSVCSVRQPQRDRSSLKPLLPPRHHRCPVARIPGSALQQRALHNPERPGLHRPHQHPGQRACSSASGSASGAQSTVRGGGRASSSRSRPLRTSAATAAATASWCCARSGLYEQPGASTSTAAIWDGAAARLRRALSGRWSAPGLDTGCETARRDPCHRRRRRRPPAARYRCHLTSQPCCRLPAERTAQLQAAAQAGTRTGHAPALGRGAAVGVLRQHGVRSRLCKVCLRKRHARGRLGPQVAQGGRRRRPRLGGACSRSSAATSGSRRLGRRLALGRRRPHDRARGLGSRRNHVAAQRLKHPPPRLPRRAALRGGCLCVVAALQRPPQALREDCPGCA